MNISAHLLRVCELLDDGDWHDYEWLIREAGRVIPPGKAMRQSERVRAKWDGAPERRVRSRSDEQLIRSGKRSILHDAISHSPAFQTRQTDHGREIRMVHVPPRVLHYRNSM